MERLYVLCFVTTRLIYVSLLWHEIYYNYPDKSVSFLYTITLSLHVYWFVLYIRTQKRFQTRQRRQQLCAVLESLASSMREEILTLETNALAIKENLGFKQQPQQRTGSTRELNSPLLTHHDKRQSNSPPRQVWEPKHIRMDETGLPVDEHENKSAIDDQVVATGGNALRPSLSRNMSSRGS